MNIRFWIDGRDYHVPEKWMSEAVQARRALGMNPTEAVLDAMRAWAKENLPSKREAPKEQEVMRL